MSATSIDILPKHLRAQEEAAAARKRHLTNGAVSHNYSCASCGGRWASYVSWLNHFCVR